MSSIKIHVSHDFTRYNANDAFSFGKIIINGLTTNAATFPNLPITVTDLTAANVTLNNTYLDYQQGGENQKGAYLDAFNNWKVKFNKTADYCDLIADGDEAIINKSGFKTTKSERSPSSKVDRLVNLDAVGIRPSGIVHMSCDNLPQTGNKGYLFMLSKQNVDIKQNGDQLDIVVDGISILSIYAGTSKIHDFNNLDSMTKYHVHGLGFNAAGMGLLTDTIDVLVQ